MQITCPSCGAQYSVNEARIPPQGVSIKCPKCEKSFTVHAGGQGAGGVPLPGAGGGVPLPGAGGGGVPLPGASVRGGVPLPGMGGGGGVPLPGAGAGGRGVPLPGGGGGVPLPGTGGGVPLPGMGGGVPLPGMGGGVPLPGMGGGVPLPGMGAPGPAAKAAAKPAGGGKPPGQAASLSDIFGDLDEGARGVESAPPHPFHGDNSFIVDGAGGGVPDRGATTGDGLLDFMGAPPRVGPQSFQIRKRSGQIIGPFDEQTVLAMLQRQELAGNEEASTDATSWRPLGQIPAFKETIQRAMAAALSGLDLPGLRDSTDLPGLRGGEDLPGLRDADTGLVDAGARAAAGAHGGDAAQYAGGHASTTLHPAILARRRKRRTQRMAVAAAVVVVLGAGGALELTPLGAFGWRKAKALVKPPEPEKVDAPPPLPELPEPTVPPSQLLRQDTYVAYRQGAEMHGKIVEAGKALEKFPPAAQKAAGEQARFLAYLLVVERVALFKEPLVTVLPQATPGDLGKLLGEVALTYDAGGYDEGIRLLEPFTDEGKGLDKETLSDVHFWIALGKVGKNEALGAQKALDTALTHNTANLAALWLQAALLEKGGEADAALGYADKALELAPNHPRTNLVKARLLAQRSETRKDGRELFEAMTDGERAPDAAPIQKAEAFMGRADLAIGDLEWDKALAHMNKAIEQVPQNREMRLRQGELALKLREFALARDAFKALVDMSGDDVAAMVGLARAKIGSRDALGGYSDLQEFITKKADDALVTYWFGVAARELLKLDEARKLFEKAQKLDPKWSAPGYELVLDLIDQGKLKEALDLAAKAEGAVNAGERHRLRAVKSAIFMRQRNYGLAQKELAAALKENPTDVDARVRFVELLVTNEQLEDAAEHAKEARLFDPKNPSVIAASGIVEAARGDHKRALELFEEAITLAPNDHRLCLHAAASAIALEDFGRAKSFVDAAGQLQPKNPEVLNYRGQVMRATDPKLAVRIFAEAIELSPDDPRLPHQLGNTFQMMGSNLEAKDAYQKAINLDPAFADAYFGKGVSLRELGKTQEAVVSFKRVADLDKKRPDTHIQLAEILTAQGDPKGAISAYEKAMEADPKSSKAICAMGGMLVQTLGNEPKYLKKGVESLESCVGRDPRHTAAFSQLGDAYREMRKNKKAIDAYKTHLRNNPEDPNVGQICEYLNQLGSKCE